MSDFEGKTVLVIDDDTSMLELLKLIYSKANAQVHVASSGQEGLREFYACQPDLVLLDLMMPKVTLDGWDTIAAFKSDDQLTHIPIIVLSALSVDNAKKRAFDKTDPYGFAMEERPRTGSVVANLDRYRWHDESWMTTRKERQSLDRPALASHEGVARHRTASEDAGTRVGGPGLSREGQPGAGTAQSAAAAGSLPESRILPRTGHAPADLQQAKGGGLRRRSLQAPGVAARLSGGHRANAPVP